jgi:methylthioribose-1-phosphate isomerase
MARKASAQDHDATRREFFRHFGRQTIQSAGAMAGAAAELRRSSMEAARELFDVSEVAATEVPIRSSVEIPSHSASAAADLYRSAYRFTGSSMVVLDQRELPERVLTFECHAANDVASALRSGAITRGPVMGEVAAYGMALAALSATERTVESRNQVMGAARGALKAARGEVHAVAQAVERVSSRYYDLANEGASGAAIAERMTAEADKIALEQTAACAEIGRLWSELLAGAMLEVGGQLDVVVNGDSGALSCGMVGMSTSALSALLDAGRSIHVWVPAGAPVGEGTRITALQLTQLDIPHTVIPDSALGWLFASRQVAAVALRGDTVVANGDVVSSLGAVTVARLAHDSDVPVHVLAPRSAWDAAAVDVSHLVLDLRSAAELGSAKRARLEPPFDVVPAQLVDAYVSEVAA